MRYRAGTSRAERVVVWVLVAVLGAVAGLAAPPQRAAGTSATTASALPFVEDDYARARAEAQKRKVPLFIEAWAPW